MKKSLAILLLAVLFVGSELQAQDVAKPELRTWKDSTGQFSIQATFVRVNGELVVLQGIDKKEISLPLAKLSAADQQYVKARLTSDSSASKTITNTIGGKPDIDDFGRSVLAAVKTRNIQELAKTYASFDELLEIKERWDSVSTIKMPIDVSREQFEQIPNLEKVIRYFSIGASKLPEDAKYLACKPGLLIRPNEETKATAEQIGLERTNNARVIASDDKNLYIISLDSLTGTPLGWFTTGDYFKIDVVPINDELKSSVLRIQQEYEANGWPERWHPLTIVAEKRVLEFVESQIVDARKTITNTIGIKLNLIPAGTFIMGSPETEKDRGGDEHQHRVTITKAFYMQTTEVTQGQWKAVMGTEPWRSQDNVKEGASYPATYVSWDNAVAYCNKLSEKEGKTYRLPTEAEWEYACRAGTQTTWSFGNDEKALGEYTWYAKNAWDIDEKYAHQVELKKPNAFGLYDMYGNVWEWCHDYYEEDYYKQSPEQDPMGPARNRSSRQQTILRGGTIYSSNWPRSANRGMSFRYRTSFGGGFRLVRELD